MMATCAAQIRHLASPAPAKHIAEIASRCLLEEIDTYPKPGLVSHVDGGSHTDMHAAMLRASVVAIAPFFAQLAEAGADQADLTQLRAIGRAAEVAMLVATGGVNTHRGAIFGMGLLAAAAGALGAHPGTLHAGALGRLVRDRYGDAISRCSTPLHGNGAWVRRVFRVGGAPAEAAAGFPSIYQIGLPSLHDARGFKPGAARLAPCLALIAVVEDTNLLHRGGLGGLTFARAAARGWLEAGGLRQPRALERAVQIHRAFVARRLSPGGSADLLAMTLFVDRFERWHGP